MTRSSVARAIRQFASDVEEARRDLAAAGWKEPGEENSGRQAPDGRAEGDEKADAPEGAEGADGAPEHQPRRREWIH